MYDCMQVCVYACNKKKGKSEPLPYTTFPPNRAYSCESASVALASPPVCLGLTLVKCKTHAHSLAPLYPVDSIQEGGSHEMSPGEGG